MDPFPFTPIPHCDKQIITIQVWNFSPLMCFSIKYFHLEHALSKVNKPGCEVGDSKLLHKQKQYIACFIVVSCTRTLLWIHDYQHNAVTEDITTLFTGKCFRSVWFPHFIKNKPMFYGMFWQAILYSIYSDNNYLISNVMYCPRGDTVRTTKSKSCCMLYKPIEKYCVHGGGFLSVQLLSSYIRNVKVKMVK